MLAEAAAGVMLLLLTLLLLRLVGRLLGITAVMLPAVAGRHIYTEFIDITTAGASASSTSKWDIWVYSK